MGKPKLDEIVETMKNGQDFELTDAQYKKSTGLNIPTSGKRYVERQSSVAQKAKEHGFLIEYTPSTIKYTPAKIKFKKI